MLTEEEITKLYRIWKTVMTMLKDRGYLVADLETRITKEEFINKFGVNMERKDLIIHKTNPNKPSDKIYVFFPDGVKVGVQTLRAYTELMKSENVFKAILVVQQSMSSYALSCLSAIAAKFHIQVFQETELLVNKTEHVLVPEHQPLTDQEKEALLQRYTVSLAQLPRIQVTDPIAKYYGLMRGQVVRIIRPSETAGQYITYRCVV
ncbi:hypothetical protein Nepgr_005156 [Nepenthes gracilis]|uniref:RPB5 homolog n=1 Tax=Nepenthes gracilis TaxID=150966 RepID=A0AAD3S2Y7_NEPGR|nr:hypothetical protein Nepgr_005156 [Nepenthes gracilis]